MSDKRFNFSCLPDSFLVETISDYDEFWCLNLFGDGSYPVAMSHIDTSGFKMRPRLDHWHFDDGFMVLPDGLVVLTWPDETQCFIEDGFVVCPTVGRKHFDAYTAYKIIGALPAYADHARELGIPVIGVDELNEEEK